MTGPREPDRARTRVPAPVALGADPMRTAVFVAFLRDHAAALEQLHPKAPAVEHSLQFLIDRSEKPVQMATAFPEALWKILRCRYAALQNRLCCAGQCIVGLIRCVFPAAVKFGTAPAHAVGRSADRARARRCAS